MIPRQAHHSGKNRGYTLIELAMVLLMVLSFAAFAAIKFGGTEEDRDAAMIQAAHATMEALVAQGSTRADVRPQNLDRNALVNAMRNTLSGSSADIFIQRSGANIQLQIRSNGTPIRTATYQILANGDVCLTGNPGFTRYNTANDGCHLNKVP